MKKNNLIFYILVIAVLLLTSCAKATEAPAATEATAAKFKVCQVTDTGGIDDKSFNATAWKGVTDAETQLGVEGKYLESKEVADFEKNINAFIEEDCDIIITVGYLLSDATKAAAEANPNLKFSIVDSTYDPAISNVAAQGYQTNEAAFLAGYLAAGVTKTGKVGTFGGMQIPTVTIFMDGFVRGVAYYNEVHGTSVVALGWDPENQTGLFTNDFSDQQKGSDMAVSLMDEGADIIMPVAGPVGLGSASAIKTRGSGYLIGVDYDWYVSAPEFKDIILTSVLKAMDLATTKIIKSAMDGSFKGGTVVGTLANDGVGLASYHDLDSVVSAELKAEIEQLKADIISGKIEMNPAFVVK